jgi:hypothetical protein
MKIRLVTLHNSPESPPIQYEYHAAFASGIGLGHACRIRRRMVWYGAPSNPRQCATVTEGGGFIQHLPNARSLRQAGRSISACSRVGLPVRAVEVVRARMHAIADI